MPEYVRVLDKDTGHKRSVFESEVPHGNYDVLKEDAVDSRTGLPLEAEHASPKSLSSKNKSGQSADPEKENAHG
jgi:hypothetical protein